MEHIREKIMDLWKADKLDEARRLYMEYVRNFEGEEKDRLEEILFSSDPGEKLVEKFGSLPRDKQLKVIEKLLKGIEKSGK